MEHDVFLPIVARVSPFSCAVVLWSILPGASVSGGNGDVFSGAQMDRKPRGCWTGRDCFCIQRLDLVWINVAALPRGLGLVSLGGARDGKSLARRRQTHPPRGYVERDAIVVGRSR